MIKPTPTPRSHPPQKNAVFYGEVYSMTKADTLALIAARIPFSPSTNCAATHPPHAQVSGINGAVDKVRHGAN